jgi:hypothetical protein
MKAARTLSLGLVVAVGGCRGSITSEPRMPEGVRFVSRAEWGAQAPVLPMKSHVPDRITIHHTGVAQNFTRTIEQKITALQQFSQRDDSLADGRRKPAWADVPYHYYIDVTGAVAEGRDWRGVGDSNTPYDPTGHLLIVVEGNFERDTLTTAQARTLDALVPAFARHFRIGPERLGAHRDFADTSCPGADLYRRLPSLRERIAAARR